MSDSGRKSYGVNAADLRGGRNQEDIAEAGGWDQSYISQLEKLRDEQLPSPATIVRHAKALGVEPWQLLEGVETEIDRLRKRPDLLRQEDVAESSARGDHEKTADSAIGTERARSRPIQPRRTADAEARLRKEIDDMRAALEMFAKVALGAGTAAAPEAPAMAPRKSGRRRRTRKRA